MLVLTRKLNERIMIGDDIVITFVELRSDNSVRIGIDAPRGVRIQREEILTAVADSNRAASHADTSAGAALRELLGKKPAPAPEPDPAAPEL